MSTVVVDEIKDSADSTAIQTTRIADLNAVKSASVGFYPVKSFEKGYTITTRLEALLLEADGNYYRWAGALPKVVPVDGTIGDTGGMGASAWVAVDTNILLVKPFSPKSAPTTLVVGSKNLIKVAGDYVLPPVTEVQDGDTIEVINKRTIQFSVDSNAGANDISTDSGNVNTILWNSATAVKHVRFVMCDSKWQV